MSTMTEKEDYSRTFLDTIDLNNFKSETDQRRIAFEKLKNIGLPHPKSEEYKFTPITKLLAKYFEAGELKRTATSTRNLGDLIQKEDRNNCIVFVNGHLNKELSSFQSSSQPTIQPLAETFEKRPELVNKLSEVDKTKDPFALINTALWNDGVCIQVPKNVVSKDPLTIYHLHDASQEKVTAHTKIVVVVEQGAELTLLEKSNSNGELPIFNTITEEIFLDENASFDYFKIQNDPGQLIQISNTTVHQQNSSRANTFTFSLNGKLIRNNLNIIIDGEGCESHFYGLYLTDSDTLVDNHTTVDHRKPNSFSNELYKGLMDGKSKGVFNGKIFVRPHAQKTNAFQSNRNILLSDTATINTKPQLEIWADDVKCSHGCTTGQLDDEALFYLRSRGIPKATAKAMLLYAFAGEVIDAITNEKLKSYIDSIISERLHKSF